ncbi:MAG: histidine kinase [Gammaproteobacteria bacterium SG8_15]|nr:MAG: histidine kinase [Gammaproteobacteria bacterium SG8_15]
MIQGIELYKQIVEGLTNAVLLLNNDLQLEYINPAGEILFEVSSRRLKGTSIDELFSSDQSLNDEIRHALVTGNPFTQRERDITLMNRRIVAADCVVTPLLDAKDRANAEKRLMLIEINSLNRGIRVSRDEHNYAQSNAMRAMIRGLAHEIKNPLGGLRGAAQLLERELHDEELKEFTNIIIGEADRLRNLVNRLLGPNKPPQREAINIHEITEHLTQLLNADKPEGVRILHDYDPSIPEVEADRDQLIQALLNIAVNALHAVGNEGSITFKTRALRHFTIGQTHHKLVCQVEIIDDGPGIPEDITETIFIPMVTSRADGSGLGLSISQSLIQQHGGMIQCKSEPGNTVFTVFLPFANSKQH